jgi:hypothetical protein
MTVKELKERLNQFHDNCIVCIPNPDFDPNTKGSFQFTVALNVTQGCNELDGVVFIDDYVEDDENE